MLAPGNGKTKTAHLWTYVRDDRQAGDATPPAVWFAYTPDRKGIHPQTHLAKLEGVLQADAYAGFNALFDDDTIREAACWAHARRKFYDLHAARPTPLTTATSGVAALNWSETLNMWQKANKFGNERWEFRDYKLSWPFNSIKSENCSIFKF